LAAPAPKEEGDAKALQGTWQAVTYEANGVAQKDVADHVACTCDKDVFTFKYDGKVSWKARLKLDPSKKPKAIDPTITEGGERGPGDSRHLPAGQGRPNVVYGDCGRQG
jgi:uncharacterized protein (TIGR03067 family)